MDGLRYPVLLVHGMGFRDFKNINYWGRIPQKLSEHGAKIYYGHQDSNGSIEGNARQLEKSLKKALADSGAQKVNIIAHSKGGLEARYLISSMGYADKVASLTTISTPHNGSVTVDRLVTPIRPLVKAGCKAADLWFRILGDESPDTYSAVRSFETENAARFNRNNPDSDKVYYQSYAFAMKKPVSDMFMWWTWLVVNHFEGENDGLLSPAATKWTNFKGVHYGTAGRGISHCDEVDMRRSSFSKNKDGDISDIADFYGEIADNLKEMGF
ncbi:MAG: esterase/lipase family protein [Huintestinicola sp.]